MKHHQTNQGQPYPLGATIKDEGVNFSIFSEHAEKITLVLLHEKTDEIIELISFDPSQNKTGYIWHILVKNLKLPAHYAYRIEGDPTLYHPKYLLLDPYAKLLKTNHRWGETLTYHPISIIDHIEPFDWENVKAPGTPSKDLIIYEMHVRGFTQDGSSHVKNRGTFSGIIEKIPYLLDLGVNAIELMPIHEFNECSNHHMNPNTDERLYNFWGYSPIHFFYPMQRFSSSDDAKKTLLEFKTMVKEMHRHGIEVFLDVVFNHTGEKKSEGSVYSFLGIDRPSYYILEKGIDANYSGCGNTLNCNHPIMQQFFIDCMRYWVNEMHVDGFRFDLASILNRDTDGKLMPISSLIANMTYDPYLSKTKLIAEPWDAALAYQLGGFYRNKNRWSEWNGKYRDAIRMFIKGDPRSKNDFAAAISGSEMIFSSRAPQASINFITAHDGFTLTDLVSYENKHNLENGEKNQDGNNTNFSANYGVEGPCDDDTLLALRLRQKKNFILALMLSQGIPMIFMGDEYGHTKHGNNNTYCHDNALNYFLWDEIPKNKELFDFMKAAINFRKTHPCLKRESFFKEDEILWHGVAPMEALWDHPDPIIAFTILDFENRKDLYVAFNATKEKLQFTLPQPPDGKKWMVRFDTAKDSANDDHENTKAVFLDAVLLDIAERSAIVLEAYSSI